MVSQRGVLNLYHSDAQRAPSRGAVFRAPARRPMPNCSTREQVRAMVPFLDYDNARFPIHGALLQRRGGTRGTTACVGLCARSRHARRRQHRELRVTGFGMKTAASRRSHHARHHPGEERSALAVPANTSRVGAMAGLRLPIESMCCKPFVSEGIQSPRSTRSCLRRRAFLNKPVGQGGLVFGGTRRLHSYAGAATPIVEA